jgi:MoxR-like ATPase
VKHSDHPLIGRKDELAMLTAILEAGRHALIEGPVGVGKTHLAESAARQLSRSVIRVDGDERFTEDKMTGWFDPPAVMAHGYTDQAFQPGPLHQAMINGAVLFINELNRMPEGVQNVLLPVMDEKRLEVPRLGPVTAVAGFQVIATQNPREFVGTALVSEALRDRFELLVLDYQSFDEEKEIVRQITSITNDRILSQSVFVARATRTHPLIKRGASVRAAVSIALIASRLDGEDAVEKAAMMALPTRVEFKEDLEEDPKQHFTTFLDDVFKKKTTNPKSRIGTPSLPGTGPKGRRSTEYLRPALCFS